MESGDLPISDTEALWVGMPSVVARCGLAEITRTRLLESVGLKLVALTLSGTENDQVICWFTFIFCTQKEFHQCNIF